MNDQELLQKIAMTLNSLQKLNIYATVTNIATLAGCMQYLQDAAGALRSRMEEQSNQD